MRMHFPAAFGQVKKGAAPDVKSMLAQTRREAALDEAPAVGPPRPPVGGGGDSDAEDGGGGGAGAADAALDPYNLPVTHEAVLSGHTRLVSALDVEHSGSRMVTGGYDFGVRLYDFAGMKRDLRPFRELEPVRVCVARFFSVRRCAHTRRVCSQCGSHQIRAVSWSPSGDAFLVVAASAEPKVLDRDGRELGFFTRGDMYIRDLKHTRGHIMGCTSGAWHPRDKSVVLTSSEDGTLRLWDITYISKEGGAASGKCQTAVVKAQSSKPGRLGISACAWSPDGGMIAGGVSDGSIQLWSTKSNFASAAVGQVAPPRAQMQAQQHWTYATRPVGTAKGAHAPGEDGEVTALRFRRDGTTLASRSCDGTLKLWDVRKLQAPLFVADGLPTSCPQAGLTFSPDEGLVLTTLSDGREGTSGGVAFFETATLKFVRRLGVPAATTGPVAWHPKLNQLFLGTGGRSSGACRVLYDPEFSEKGALLCVTRAPRLKDAMDLIPFAEAAYERPEAGGGGRKRQREQQMQKKLQQHVPQGPAGTYGAGGRVGGGTGGSLLTQYLLKERGVLFNPDKEMDPREAILRHSAAGELVDTAYAATQPKRIFAEIDDEEEEEEFGAPPPKK